MAALTIGNDVAPVQMDTQAIGIAGADLDAGMPVYLDGTDGTYKPADSSAAGTAGVRGIALSDTSQGFGVTLMRKGIMNIGDDTLDSLDFDAEVFLGTTPGGLDDTGVGQNVVIGRVYPGWASRPPDKLLVVDL
jgi:hypothetical protein